VKAEVKKFKLSRRNKAETLILHNM